MKTKGRNIAPQYNLTCQLGVKSMNINDSEYRLDDDCDNSLSRTHNTIQSQRQQRNFHEMPEGGRAEHYGTQDDEMVQPVKHSTISLAKLQEQLNPSSLL